MPFWACVALMATVTSTLEASIKKLLLWQEIGLDELNESLDGAALCSPSTLETHHLRNQAHVTLRTP